MRAWSPARFSIPLPFGHRFPMGKYALIRDEVVRAGVLPLEAIQEPEPVSRRHLEAIHDPSYVAAIFAGTLTPAASRALGFPWSEALRERACRTVQGTLEAARDALASGGGINLGGGTHHAFADRGEGFCVFNDVAVAIRVLQGEGALRRAAVVDLDVHQGNGTARIFADDPTVYTFSMHGARNYPFRKENSRLDVGLADGMGDGEYLALLEQHLERVLDGMRPDLVCYLAGADPYLGDRFGRLRLTRDGLRRRDRLVFQSCRRRGLPAVMVLAGGYAARLEDVAEIHLTTVKELLSAYR